GADGARGAEGEAGEALRSARGAQSRRSAPAQRRREPAPRRSAARQGRRLRSTHPAWCGKLRCRGARDPARVRRLPAAAAEKHRGTVLAAGLSRRHHPHGDVARGRAHLVPVPGGLPQRHRTQQRACDIARVDDAGVTFRALSFSKVPRRARIRRVLYRWPHFLPQRCSGWDRRWRLRNRMIHLARLAIATVALIFAPPCLNVPSAGTPYLASRRVAFIRCTLSPARWLQMMASRTSLSARRSKTPVPAWRSRLSSVTSWITSVEKFMASPAFAECTLWSCSQATRIANE